MPSMLLTATSLFMATPTAGKPAAEVVHPVTNPCRVTGNLIRPVTKSIDDPTCRVVLADSSHDLPLSLATVKGEACSATGAVVRVKDEPMCRFTDGTLVLDLSLTTPKVR